ncbi:MAG: rhodanese-like domain-containing protein [Anaerolineae bacterium]|nr:MAG: rhodanese-like domain-containing protein [Anaerolineae bacterium]
MGNKQFSEWMQGRNFAYWSTGQHKVMPNVLMEKWAAGEAVLLDVRAAEETEFLALPFALHIPLDELPDRLDEVPRDKLVVTFCSGGDRANVAFAYLQNQGFDNVRVMPGGYANLIPELMPGKVRLLLKKRAS